MKLLTPLILLGTAVGLFFLFINPQYKEVQSVRAEITEYDKAIEQAKEVGEKRNQLLAKRNSFSADEIKRLQKMIPDKVDNIRLVIDINERASQYGSELKGIGFTNVTDADKKTVGAVGSPYNVTSMTFTVAMTYEQLQKFLGDLEKSLRLIDVSTITFAPVEDSIYNFSIGLKTYSLK
jgi:Tfp pilus assembly protein PilO